MSTHIGTRQLYPVKGGYYVPAETFRLLQDYPEDDWPEIISIIASYTEGYSKKSCLDEGEAIDLLAKFSKKEKIVLEVDDRMQKILLALVERSPRRIWEIAEAVEPPIRKGKRIIPSPHLRIAIKKMNGSLIMSTKSEIEITPSGLELVEKLVGPARMEEARRQGEVTKVAREKDLQERREKHIAYGML
jgi:hypothetical protein